MKSFPARPTEGELHLWLLAHGKGNLAHLSSAERVRCQSYRLKKDRDRYAFTQSAKRQILGEYLHQSPAKIAFQENKYGKPFVAGLEFSISHTAGTSILAIVKESPVGIDIEAIDPPEKFPELAKRICSSIEKIAFDSLPEEEKSSSLYRLWTAKEAYLKCLGIGFKIEPDEVETDFPKLSSCRAKDHPPLNLLEIILDKEFSINFASEKPIRQLHQFNFPS